MADVTMPQLGETVTEGTITKWFKKVGDAVAVDEPLFEVSTDKVDTEVPSPTAGFIAEIKVNEGETVDVGAVIAVISADAGAAAPHRRRPKRLRLPRRQHPLRLLPLRLAAAAPRSRADCRPGARASRLSLTPPFPVAPAPRARAEAAPSENGGGPTGSRLLSPVVRRLVAEHGLDPAAIEGSGAGGRITREDVLAHIDDAARRRRAPRRAGRARPLHLRLRRRQPPRPRRSRPGPPRRWLATSQPGQRDEVVALPQDPQAAPATTW